MYTTKEQAEAKLLPVNQIKQATLNVAKGLSRVQAKQAAASATRNVNAYGQKEEGPSRWQERKEAKRQMYLMSTEKAVKLGVRKDNKSIREGLRVGVRCQQIQCQRCFGVGHWTFECKNERVYVSRPSRTQQLLNPSICQPSLELCDPAAPPKSELEVEVYKKFTSNIFASFEERKSRKSNQTPPRKSDLRNRKRRRSKKSSSSETPSSEESPSKSDSESEVSSSSSEELSSTTYSSSTMSSPSRTSSSSKKTSSYSSTDPPTPESDSEEKSLDKTVSTHSTVLLAAQELSDLEASQFKMGINHSPL